MNLNKIKRYLCIAALTAGAAAMAAGCARKAETPAQGALKDTVAELANVSAEASGPAVSETVPDAAASTEAMTTARKPTGPAVSGDVVSIITGTVTDAGTSTVTITTAKYPEGLTFSTEDAATGFAEGPLVGQELTLFYSGEIKDKDASAVTVELIRDKRDGDEDTQAALVSGKIAGIGMSVVTIETTDGKSISFEQNPKPVNTTEGPLEGEEVTIIYSYQDEAHEGAVVPELIRKK